MFYFIFFAFKSKKKYFKYFKYFLSNKINEFINSSILSGPSATKTCRYHTSILAKWI